MSKKHTLLLFILTLTLATLTPLRAQDQTTIHLPLVAYTLHSTARASVASGGTEANSVWDIVAPAISADGRFIAFESSATNLVPDDTNGSYDIFVHDHWTRFTTRVSVASDGTEANGDSSSPSISADGHFVAFVSSASNLVPDDTVATCWDNDTYTHTLNCGDVFVHDRVTGSTTRVSVASDGTEANDSSGGPAISANSRYIAFASTATNLVPGDTNTCGPYDNENCSDIFVHDRWTGTTTRVSVASDGAQGNEESGEPSISADGRFVAFSSQATNLVPGDTNDTCYDLYPYSCSDIFVHDRWTGTTTRVSVASDGAQANGWSFSPSISADGRLVAFHSRAHNLVPGDTNICWGGMTGREESWYCADVFVHDRLTGATTCVSVASDGTQADRESWRPSISADGRIVAFESTASNLVPGDDTVNCSIAISDPVSCSDIFVHDRIAHTTVRVSVASDGAQANSLSDRAAISATGHFVAFSSAATNLVPGDTNAVPDIFLRDRGSD